MAESEQEVTYVTAEVERKSPLAQALAAHFKRHYLPDGKPNPEPYGSRNRVAPPLNLDLINATEVKALDAKEQNATQEGIIEENGLL